MRIVIRCAEPVQKVLRDKLWSHLTQVQMCQRSTDRVEVKARGTVEESTKQGVTEFREGVRTTSQASNQ